MELTERPPYKSEFKLKFKTAFRDLIETVDLDTGNLGQEELERMKECVSDLHKSKVKEVGAGYSRRDLSFISGVGQVDLSREGPVDVSIEGYSNRYEGNVPFVSSTGKASAEDLMDPSFVKRQIEDAVKNSGVYKSLKIQIVGISRKGVSGGYDNIYRLNIGIHARTDDLFFLGLVNGVGSRSKKMAVYMSDVKSNDVPMQPLDPDHIGFDSMRKAYVVRTALSQEMVLGKKYVPMTLKK